MVGSAILLFSGIMGYIALENWREERCFASGGEYVRYRRWVSCRPPASEAEHRHRRQILDGDMQLD
jgi:hypothetical protein